MDSGLDRAERDAGHLGDLGVVVALDVEQDDRGRWSSVIRASASVRARARSAVRTVALGIGLRAGRRLPAVVVELGIWLDRTAAARTLGVHRRVDADPVEPRLDAPAAEAGQIPVGREERLLDGVGGLIAVRHHPGDEREQLVLVQLDEIVECPEVARRGRAR